MKLLIFFSFFNLIAIHNGGDVVHTSNDEHQQPLGEIHRGVDDIHHPHRRCYMEVLTETHVGHDAQVCRIL